MRTGRAGLAQVAREGQDRKCDRTAEVDRLQERCCYSGNDGGRYCTVFEHLVPSEAGDARSRQSGKRQLPSASQRV
jgi:hypothetical protein